MFIKELNKMDYKQMWKEKKSTYEKRLLELEEKGKRGSNAWLSAKRFVDVMHFFELKQ